MNRSSNFPFALLVLLAVLPATGCAVSQPVVPMDRFLAGDFDAVRSFASDEIAKGEPENLALLLNVQAQCELEMGDADAARIMFQRAAQIMGTWATSGSEATGAIVGSESSKTYKGDSYEKAMNAFYLSFCYLQKGEPDNARAALKRGILMDAEVADIKYQADNALLFWMAGRMSNLYGGSGAGEYFKEARAAHSFAIRHGARGAATNPILADPTKGNLVLLLPVGLGPKKYADGQHRELARFRPQEHPAVVATAMLGEQSLGRSSILSDVDYQAMTLGGTVMEGIRKGKAVFKEVSSRAGAILLDKALRNRKRDKEKARKDAIAGGTLLLMGALTAASADVRYWPTLPSTVQVLVAEVPPGEHELVIDFLGARGKPLRRLQHRFRITVPETGEAWLLVPSLPPLSETL